MNESTFKHPRPFLVGTPYRVGDPLADGRWIVKDVAGKGAVGTVYLAQDKRDGTVLAVKTVDTAIHSKAQSDHLKSEVEKWARIPAHANLVKLFEVVSMENVIFASMEYVAPGIGFSGSSLKHLLDSDMHFEEKMLINWAIQFCHGMEHLKKHGFPVHGDIKPANILVDRTGTVKLLDFGTISPEGNPEQGSMMYMAPEKFSKEAGIYSDIYSFGLVILELMTGKFPYQSDMLEGSPGRTNWYRIHSYAQAHVPDGLLSPIIQKSTSKDPGERFQDFMELCRALEEIATDADIDIPVPSDISENNLVTAYNLLNIGETDMAKRAFTTLREQFPDSLEILKGLALCHEQSGEYQAAINLLKKADTIAGGDDSSILEQLARLMCHMEEHEKADELFSKALALTPSRHNLLRSVAQCKRKQGRHDAAREYYQESARLCVDRKLRWEALNTLNEALKFYKHDIELNRLMVMAIRLDETNLNALIKSKEFIENTKNIENDPETAGILAGVWKRYWLGKFRETPEKPTSDYFFNKALDLYTRAWEASDEQETYVGINSASLFAIQGNIKRAKAIAGKIMALYRNMMLEDKLSLQEKYSGYWHLVTMAEATLLLGEIERARSLYHEAFELARIMEKIRYMDTTLDQLNLLLPALGIADNADEFLKTSEEKQMDSSHLPDKSPRPYEPRPIQTDGIELPDHLTELVELLAESAHDTWARQRIEEGWSWGPQRNDEQKQTPCLVHYMDLPHEEKNYDRSMVVETLKSIIALGYRIDKVR